MASPNAEDTRQLVTQGLKGSIIGPHLETVVLPPEDANAANQSSYVTWGIDRRLPDRHHAVLQIAFALAVQRGDGEPTLKVFTWDDAVDGVVGEKLRPRLEAFL